MLVKAPWGKLNTSLKVAFRSSHPEYFYQKGVPKTFAKISGKRLFWQSIRLKACKLIKRRDFDADVFSYEYYGIFIVNNPRQNIVDKFSNLSKNKCFCEMS